MLEKDIEKKCGDHAKKLKIAHYKFTSPARASVPDRLLLAEIPLFLRPLIARYIRFIEYKRTGEDATDPQKREHKRLRDLGFTVDIIDNVEDGKQVIDDMYHVTNP